MRVPHLRRLSVLAAAVFVLGACTGGGASSSPGGGGGASPGAPSTGSGGSGGGGANAASLNACSLLSTDEIAATVGWQVSDGLLQDTDVQTDCEWDGQGDQAGSVGLTIQNFDDSLWQAGKSAGISTAVSGIGDEAFKGWPHAGDLSIKYKSYEVDVAIIDFYKPADTVDGETITLAKLVLSRL